MDGQRPWHYRKSPSRSRVVCETLNSEKLVWFAAVSSPLLSPGRERGKLPRKKWKQRTIFLLPRRAKISLEAEEPTSPKVSCIGEVTASKKSSGSTTQSKTDKGHLYKPASFSPGSFFTRPGRQFGWASLFGTCRGSHHVASSLPAYGGSEVSSYGLPACEPSFLCNQERNCGAFLAKSLLLLQEYRDRTQCVSNTSDAHILHAHTRVYNDGERNQSEDNSPREQSASRQDSVHQLHSSEACSDKSFDNGGRYLSLNVIAGTTSDVGICGTTFTLCHEECKMARASDEKDTSKSHPPPSSAEEEQERHSGGVNIIEARLHHHCNNLYPHAALPLICADDRGRGSNGEDHGSGIVRTFVDDNSSKSVASKLSALEEEQSASSKVDERPCIAAVEESKGCDEQLKEQTMYVSDLNHVDWELDGINEVHQRQQQDCTLDEERLCKGSFTPCNASDCVLSSIPSLPHLAEKDLHCFLIGKDTDRVWDLHKAEKRDVLSAQALILLDCDLIGSSCEKDGNELLVVSFGSGASNKKVQFVRSRSATSFATVICLRRSKSEPRKPY